MGADQKVELQPADPEEIRTGGDPTVTQEQINTTPDRLLGRRRILRIGLGAAILTAATAAFGKTAYDAMTAAPAEATTPEMPKPQIIYDGYHPSKKGLVSTRETFQPRQSFDLTAERFLSPPPRYPFLEGHPNIRLDKARILWQFVYFKDQPQYLSQIADPASKGELLKLFNGALIPFEYTYGMKVSVDNLPDIYLSQKISTEYSRLSDVAVEAIEQQGLGSILAYQQGIYTTYAIMYFADQVTYSRPYFGQAGGLGANSDGRLFGRFQIPGDLLESYIPMTFTTIAHEYKHSLGQLYHSSDPHDIMYPAGGASDYRPKAFGPEDNKIAGGASEAIPVILNNLKP